MTSGFLEEKVIKLGCQKGRFSLGSWLMHLRGPRKPILRSNITEEFPKWVYFGGHFGGLSTLLWALGGVPPPKRSVLPCFEHILTVFGRFCPKKGGFWRVFWRFWGVLPQIWVLVFPKVLKGPKRQGVFGQILVEKTIAHRLLILIKKSYPWRRKNVEKRLFGGSQQKPIGIWGKIIKNDEKRHFFEFR